MTDTREEQAPWAPDPMIPGERDPANLTHRQPGAVGGQFAGGDIPAQPADWLDERTAHERAREGGGADGERHIEEHDTPRRHGGTE